MRSKKLLVRERKDALEGRAGRTRWKDALEGRAPASPIIVERRYKELGGEIRVRVTDNDTRSPFPAANS